MPDGGLTAALSSFFFTTSASGATVLTVKGALTITAAVTAGQQILTKRELKAAQKALRSREVVISEAAPPWQVVYGERPVGGAVRYAHKNRWASDDRVAELHLLVVHASHEVEAIGSTIYFGDEALDSEITWVSDSGTVTSGDYDPDSMAGSPSVLFERHYGTTTQAASTQLLAVSATDWSSSHQLKGHAYIVYTFRLADVNQHMWAEKGLPYPNIRAMVKGAKVYDWDLDSTPGNDPDNAAYQAWSDNPIKIAVDYMRKWYRNRQGLANDRFDWAELAVQSAYCDDMVDSITGTSNQKRFVCDVVLSMAASDEENLAKILASCGGTPQKRNGLWSFEPARYVAPTLSFDDSDILMDSIRFEPALPDGERFSKCRALFSSENHQYHEHESYTRTNATYTTRDNSIDDERVLVLDGVINESQAQRLCEIELNVGNLQGTLTAQFGWAALQMVPGCRVNVTLGFPFDFSSKVFRVQRISGLGPHGGAPFEVEMREDGSTAWDALANGSFGTPSTAASMAEEDDPPIISPPTSIFEPLFLFPLNTTSLTNIVEDSVIPGATHQGFVEVTGGIADSRSVRLRDDSNHIYLMTSADANVLQGITVEAHSFLIFFKSEEKNTGESRARIISRDESEYWSIEIDQSMGDHQAVKLYLDGTLATNIPFAAKFGEWHMVGFDTDSSGNWRFWFNGRRRGYGSGYTHPISTPRPIVVGIETGVTPTTSSPFNGRVAMAAGYERQLAPDEWEFIWEFPNRWLRSSGNLGSNVPPPVEETDAGNLVAVYTGQGIYGNAVENLLPGSSYGDAAVTASVTVEQNGLAFGECLRFNNSADRMTLLSAADRATWMTSEWTISLWFKSMTNSGGDSTALIVGCDMNEYWRVTIDQSISGDSGTSHTRQWITFTAGGNEIARIKSIATATWYHLVVTGDSSGNIQMIVSGAQGGTFNREGTYTVGSASRALDVGYDSHEAGDAADIRTCLFAFWTRRITLDDAMQLYQNPTSIVDLANTGGAPAGTRVGDTRALDISNTLTAQGALALANIKDGAGDTYWPAAAGFQIVEGEDAEAITWPIPYDEVPSWVYVGGGLTWHDNAVTTAAGQSVIHQLVDVTTTGATISSRLGGDLTPTLRVDTTTFSTTDLDFGIQKLASSSAPFDNRYTYISTVTIQNGPAPEYDPGECYVGYYIRDATTNVLTKVWEGRIVGNSGEATTEVEARTIFSYTDPKLTGDVFAIHLESTLYAGSVIDSFDTVRYWTATWTDEQFGSSDSVSTLPRFLIYKS